MNWISRSELGPNVLEVNGVHYTITCKRNRFQAFCGKKCVAQAEDFKEVLRVLKDKPKET